MIGTRKFVIFVFNLFRINLSCEAKDMFSTEFTVMFTNIDTIKETFIVFHRNNIVILKKITHLL